MYILPIAIFKCRIMFSNTIFCSPEVIYLVVSLSINDTCLKNLVYFWPQNGDFPNSVISSKIFLCHSCTKTQLFFSTSCILWSVGMECWFLFVWFWCFCLGRGGSHHTACRIFVPWQDFELRLPAVEAESPNHWTSGELILFKKSVYCNLVPWLTFNVQTISKLGFLKGSQGSPLSFSHVLIILWALPCMSTQ